MVDVEFEDNRIEVKNTLHRAAVAYLYDAVGELQAKTRRNSRVDTKQTVGSYEYHVNPDKLEGVIGSNLENAIWEEFGTGEYALNHDGRKGGWYVPEEKLSEKAKTKMKKYIAKDGKVYYFTKGKAPNRPMYKAFSALKNKLIQRAKEIFNAEMGE